MWSSVNLDEFKKIVNECILFKHRWIATAETKCSCSWDAFLIFIKQIKLIGIIFGLSEN